MPHPRHPQREQILDLRAADLTVETIAERLQLSMESVACVIWRARKSGDPRAARISADQRGQRTRDTRGPRVFTREETVRGNAASRAAWRKRLGLSEELVPEYRFLRRKRLSQEEALAVLRNEASAHA
ncbi:hypothetical protein RQ831_18345 [Roseomonas gilardii]|uniref:Uncharacterized protein n=1 Tax=Roseomonas gilardii TaxID=257708 RepID=A0ABU3MJS5_9PROT|nr:hypothetical protein [Roseomonas gilardii]MDT8333017.1 hypothetical protein [Roseomonas gilardii]